MKILKLLSISMIILFISCSVESDEDANTDDNLESSNLRIFYDDDGCETGFALCAEGSSICFLEDGFNRWGWTIGPIAPSTWSQEYAIYAGAGQCDITKGVLTGTVRLEYDINTGVANVDFTALEGFVFKETHLYIGNDPYPMKQQGNKQVPTVAPGQFPYKHGDLNNVVIDTYTVDGLSGDIYIIAHAVVCLEVN